MKYVPGKSHRYGSGDRTVPGFALECASHMLYCWGHREILSVSEGWQTVVVFWFFSHALQHQVIEDLIQKHQANKNQAERAMLCLVGLGNLGHPDTPTGSTCVWLELAILHQPYASSLLCNIWLNCDRSFASSCGCIIRLPRSVRNAQRLHPQAHNN